MLPSKHYGTAQGSWYKGCEMIPPKSDHSWEDEAPKALFGYSVEKPEMARFSFHCTERAVMVSLWPGNFWIQLIQFPSGWSWDTTTTTRKTKQKAFQRGLRGCHRETPNPWNKICYIPTEKPRFLSNLCKSCTTKKNAAVMQDMITLPDVPPRFCKMPLSKPTNARALGQHTSITVTR